MNLKAIIIDDEPAAITVITSLLEQFAPEIEIAGVARNGLNAVQLISGIKPDIIYLDVNMPVMNGLKVMEHFSTNDYQVIFTTGSADYAMKALKLNATDYLLKPIDPAEFIIATERARRQISLIRSEGNARTPVRLQFPTQNEIIYMDESDITHVTGMGSYCQIHNLSNEKVTVSKNIGQIEQKLSAQLFFRCHTSHLVNLDFITRFINREGYFVELKNGILVEVSRRSKEGLLAALASRSL